MPRRATTPSRPAAASSWSSTSRHDPSSSPGCKRGWSSSNMSVLIGVAIGVVLLIILFKVAWRVAEPNQALVISGWGSNTPDGVAESLGFKIVTGKGTLVLPGVQAVRRLSLDLREAELAIDCVTHQGIPLGLKGVVIFKVGDDYTSIANAARRFLDQQDQMDHP